MAIIRCFWAGILVKKEEIPAERVSEFLKEIEKHMRIKNMKHTSCGVTHTLDKLCIDVVHEDDTEFLALSV